MDNNLQLNEKFQKMRGLVGTVNKIIQPLRKNLYNFLNDKHNNKLDEAINSITQDDGIRYQEQKVFDLFKRALYYFKVIQYDYEDEFWQRISRINDVDFNVITLQEKAQIYKSMFHLILQYQARIIQQQRIAEKQKRQAQRIKRINRIKQQQQKKKEQKQLKQQQQRQRQQQQLLQAFDKATQIIQQNFQKLIKKLGETKKIPYQISNKRRLEKSRQQKRQRITNKHTSNGITHPRKPAKPRKPRTGRKY